MDREKLIEKLAKCQYNPIKDVKALEAFSDEGLQALDAHCGEQAEAFSALQEELKDAKEELKTAQTKVTEQEKALRTAEADLRKAKKTPTEDEWMAQAPPSIKTLVERQKKQEEEKREVLVAELKTAQEEYSEEELQKMPLETLERTAKLLKINQEQVDYGASRPIPKMRTAGEKDDPYKNPPDPYAEGVKKLQGQYGKTVN